MLKRVIWALGAIIGISLAATWIVSHSAGPVQSAPVPAQAVSQPAAPSQLTPLPVHDRLYIRSDSGSPSGPLAVIDAATGTQEQTLPFGVPSLDWSTLYTADYGQGHTTVRAVDVTTGQTLRQTQLQGEYDLTSVDMNDRPDGLSHNGRWLVLTQVYTDAVATQSRLIVLDTAFARPPTLIQLDGNYWFDAISDDGNALYLIQPLSEGFPPNYQVRLFDVAQGKLTPDPVVDKSDTEIMNGYRQSSAASPDGKWLFSLYLRGGRGPFIHALNLNDRFAVCIDLPSEWGNSGEQQLLWSLAMTPDGTTLYAVNAALGYVAQVDTAQLAVRRTATWPVPTATVPRGLARLAQWLAPTAEAKRILVGGAALAPDGRTLFALGETGLLVVNTNDLALRGRYLTDWTFDSLALSTSGARLYLVSAERNKVLQLDPASGQVVAEVSGASQPWGIWHVAEEPTRAATEPDASFAACPVTKPPAPPFVPPPPNSPGAPFAGQFWYGTEALWTLLPSDGTWQGLPHNPEGYSQKVFWWRKGYSWTAEPAPQLSVTGRRLDGPAQPLNVSKATNAFAQDIQSAMLVGVDFPTLGCWEITGRYQGHELSFVVQVSAETAHGADAAAPSVQP